MLKCDGQSSSSGLTIVGSYLASCIDALHQLASGDAKQSKIIRSAINERTQRNVQPALDGGLKCDQDPAEFVGKGQTGGVLCRAQRVHSTAFLMWGKPGLSGLGRPFRTPALPGPLNVDNFCSLLCIVCMKVRGRLLLIHPDINRRRP